MRVALRLQPDDNAFNRARRVAGIAKLYVGDHRTEFVTPEVRFAARVSGRVSLLVRWGAGCGSAWGCIIHYGGQESITRSLLTAVVFTMKEVHPRPLV